MSEERKEVKLVFIGDTGVGKSSIVKRWVENKYPSSLEPTIGAYYSIKMLENCKYQIWDTAGQERFRSILPMYLRSAKIAVFVIDLSNPNGLNDLEPIVNEAKQHLPKDAIMILVGNKQDLGSAIDDQVTQEFCEKHQIDYKAKCSVLTKNGLDEFLHCIATATEKLPLQNTYDKSSAQISPPTLSSLSAKLQELKALCEKNPNRKGVKNITAIVNILEAGTCARDAQSYFDTNLDALKKEIDGLRWTWRSVLNTVVNVVLAVFAALSIVGLPLLYCLGVWKPNSYNGVLGSFRFCTFGDKQKMQDLCEETFEETDVANCQFSQF